MAKVKCRSCDICGEMNAKDGFMLKAKRMESHNVRDTLEIGRASCRERV